jgi:two-component system alkaline phosphatase synthesis response regulator PhoP
VPLSKGFQLENARKGSDHVPVPFLHRVPAPLASPLARLKFGENYARGSFARFKWSNLGVLIAAEGVEGDCMNELVVVIEDEEDIRELIRYNLEKDGYRVLTARSGEEGISMVLSAMPELVMLDLMLPGMDGLQVCREIKAIEKLKEIPVVMVTARGEESDVVSGLELGADDYITKPFSPKVLVARVRAALRRRVAPQPTIQAVVRHERLVVNPQRREVAIDNERIELTNTEFKLLHFLIRQPGVVFTRDQIVDGVHGDDYPVTDRSVDVQIVGLRKKLLEYGACIETVRGVGYRFKG